MDPSQQKQIFQMQKKGFEDISKGIKDLAEVKPIPVEIPAGKPFTIYAEPGKPGEPGKNGTTPKKGVDYFTDDEIEEFKQDILSRIPPPEKGEDGEHAAIDYDRIEKWLDSRLAPFRKPKQGEPGKPGKNAEIDYEKLALMAARHIDAPKSEDIKAYVERQIERIEEYVGTQRRVLNSGGPTTRLGEISDVNLAGLDVGESLVWNGLEFVPGTASGGSYQILETASPSDDSNLAFVFASKPKEIVIRGLSYTETGDSYTWTWNAGTFTATLNQPTYGGRIYGRT